MNMWGAIIALIRYEICGVELSDCEKNYITSADFDVIYKLSKRHELAQIVGESLKKNGFITAEKNSNAYHMFENERMYAMIWYEQSRYEIENICSTFEKHAIPYITLKGIVQRELYKSPWQRRSCDLDVLVKEQDLDRAVQALHEDLGYVVGKKTANEQSLQSPSEIHLELHYDMTEQGVFTNQVLKNIWDYAVDFGGKYSYRKKLIPAAYYYCHIQHMKKHFRNGGCGIRTLLDLWIIKNNTTCRDFDDDSLTKNSECAAFSTAVEQLSRVWFEKIPPDELSLQMQDYIFNGGIYGSSSNVVKIGQTKHKNKFKYVLSRIFISNKELKEKYPVLKDKPILIPFYHVKRWFRPLFVRSSAKRTMRDLSATIKTDAKTLELREEMLKKIGVIDDE